ncbi:hypothetical protein BDK51DRAFT_32914 [Blyttiomyces helicus]|uniref:Uncharacterized protein n=1 Tax=Blyttiomyces helicus TaxID=388810 RepID=A0A4P9W0A6_9FUNG|nr:hypothetical protein BDK51DRAFT_32914 [Blyttiomyces helicus]|eukprot:RKO84523.1 hypothetical protein BDK51DRAFT_32914 [Blyttiomyces helicus]
MSLILCTPTCSCSEPPAHQPLLQSQDVVLQPGVVLRFKPLRTLKKESWRDEKGEGKRGGKHWQPSGGAGSSMSLEKTLPEISSIRRSVEAVHVSSSSAQGLASRSRFEGSCREKQKRSQGKRRLREVRGWQQRSERPLAGATGPMKLSVLGTGQNLRRGFNNEPFALLKALLSPQPRKRPSNVLGRSAASTVGANERSRKKIDDDLEAP